MMLRLTLTQDYWIEDDDVEAAGLSSKDDVITMVSDQDIDGLMDIEIISAYTESGFPKFTSVELV